jgi:single-stranded DNA-binding protein
MFSNTQHTVNGNVVREPFYKQGADGKQSFCSFRIAVNVEKEVAVFIPVKCFGYTADSCADLKKGSKVVVMGRNFLDSWTKEDTQEEVESIGIIADSVGIVTKTAGKKSTKEEF